MPSLCTSPPPSPPFDPGWDVQDNDDIKNDFMKYLVVVNAFKERSSPLYLFGRPPYCITSDEVTVKLPSDDDRTCTICAERMDEGHTVSLLACVHDFHPHCFSGWAISQATQRRPVKCPNCREAVRLILCNTRRAVDIMLSVLMPTSAEIDAARNEQVQHDLQHISQQQPENELAVNIYWTPLGQAMRLCDRYIMSQVGGVSRTMRDLHDAPKQLGVIPYTARATRIPGGYYEMPGGYYPVEGGDRNILVLDRQHLGAMKDRLDRLATTID